MVHTVSDEVFKYLKERANTLDYSIDLDPRIAPFVERFNKLENAVTVWSCSGHTLAECQEQLERGDSMAAVQESYNKAYIIFVVNEADQNRTLKILSDNIAQAPYDMFLYQRPGIDLVTLTLNDYFKDETSTYKAIQFYIDPRQDHYEIEELADFWDATMTTLGV